MIARAHVDNLAAVMEPKEEAPLSHKAELFRSRLIEEFQILECTSEQGKSKIPVYSTNDINGKIFTWLDC